MNVIIERPVELIKYKDRIVEVEVEKIVETPVEVRRRALNSQYRSAGTLKGTLKLTYIMCPAENSGANNRKAGGN